MNLIITRTTSKISGAENYNKHLLGELVKYKNISIAVLTNSKTFARIIKKEGPVSEAFNLPIGEIGTKKDFIIALLIAPIYIPIFLNKINNYKIKSEKNIVIMQSMTEKIFMTMFLSLLKYKIVWIEHGPVFRTERAKIIKILYKLSFNFVNQIIAVSKDTQNDLISSGLNRNKIKVIYIGLHAKKMVKKFSKKDKKIGFIGTVEEIKGINRYMDVANLIISKDKNYSFLVLGNGVLLGESKKRARDLKINSFFEFKGHVEDVNKYLDKIDLLFLPTNHSEGISMAILESLARGVVVYTHNIGGNNELITNKINGFLYDKYNANKQAQEILRITKNQKLMAAVSKSAKLLVDQKFNLKKNTKEFYDNFLDL